MREFSLIRLVRNRSRQLSRLRQNVYSSRRESSSSSTKLLWPGGAALFPKYIETPCRAESRGGLRRERRHRASYGSLLLCKNPERIGACTCQSTNCESSWAQGTST